MICNGAISKRQAAIGSRSRAGGVGLRRRSGWFLPVALLALALQILAPIAASSVVAAALADPLQDIEICHGAPDQTPSPTDRDTGHHASTDCLACCLLHAGGALDTPQEVLFSVLLRPATPIVWHGDDLGLVRFRTGPHAQARAPPFLP
jgi:Protein of unknown function (DUF2946)